MGYVRDATRGVAFIGAFRVVTRVVAFGKTILLARLLSPNDLGLFGVVALTLSLLEVATETGVNTVLVQLKDDSDHYIDSAWAVSIIRGVLISFVMMISAGTVANFFHVPGSTHLILLASLVPLFRGLINPSEVNFQKHLLFEREFVFRTVVFLIDAITSILLTIITHDPISLVWGILAGAISEMILSHVFLTPHPRFVFNYNKLRFVLKRGKWLTATGILDYFIQNGDNMVVGRLLGGTPLGFYQMAYQVSTAPVAEISNILSKVSFPILVKMSHERDRMKNAYIKMTIMIGAFSGIATILFVVFGHLFVSLILGSKWLSIVPTLQVLAVFAFVKSLVLSTYALLLAHGRQEKVTFVSVTGFIAMFAVIVPLVYQFGIIGAAMAAFFGAIISLIPAGYYVYKS